jgi:26S proteasome regulatory subunit N1
MNGPGVAGLLTVLHACLDMKGTILDKMHYILYYLAPAMNPKFMATLDESLSLISTTVRVGQAVETVGQAGRPRTITGFQTHSTPVLLNFRDRAELAGKEYKSLAGVIEGFVILQKEEESTDTAGAK